MPLLRWLPLALVVVARPPITEEEEAEDLAPHLFSIAIVGRPNVGKSTLFNRIVGGQVAIVEDRPGVTRDRNVMEAEWLGTRFNLVDTGGWLPGGTELDEKVSRQVEAAVREADVVLFVVDASVGLTDDDQSVALWLRRIKSPVLVVANTADNDRKRGLIGNGLSRPDPWSGRSRRPGRPGSRGSRWGRRFHSACSPRNLRCGGKKRSGRPCSRPRGPSRAHRGDRPARTGCNRCRCRRS
jgi:small GTP-binding protein